MRSIALRRALPFHAGHPITPPAPAKPALEAPKPNTKGIKHPSPQRKRGSACTFRHALLRRSQQDTLWRSCARLAPELAPHTTGEAGIGCQCVPERGAIFARNADWIGRVGRGWHGGARISKPPQPTQPIGTRTTKLNAQRRYF